MTLEQVKDAVWAMPVDEKHSLYEMLLHELYPLVDENLEDHDDEGLLAELDRRHEEAMNDPSVLMSEEEFWSSFDERASVRRAS